MTKFKLKKGVTGYTEVNIIKDGILVKSRSNFQYKEFKLPFSNIGNTYSVIKEINDGLLFFVFSFAIVAIIFSIVAINNPEKSFGFPIVSLLLALFFYLLTVLTTKRELVIDSEYGYKVIGLPYTRKNIEEVRKYAELIIEKTNEYLKNRYTKIDLDLPKDEQLNNLLVLKEREIIDEKEFLKLKNYLLGKDKERIGYS